MFSQRLQYLIDVKKISQADVASGIDVQRSRISDWLSGKVKTPRKTTLFKIADYFECDPNWLISGEGNPFPEKDSLEDKLLNDLERTERLQSTLGGRIQFLMGKFTTHKQLADAIGINRSRITDLINNKVKAPHFETIQKIAGFFNCNPEWLENGTGSIFDDNPTPGTDYHIPASKRLEYLKGNMTLKAFSRKCGIDSLTMSKYLETGRISVNEDVIKIAKAFNTSIGWLTSGEAWQGSNRKFTGFTFEKHLEIGEKLYEIQQEIQSLKLGLDFSYPLIGKLGRPRENAAQCDEALTNLRSNLEENLFDEHREQASFDVYYCADRLEKNKKNKIRKSEIIKHLADFISDTYNDETGLIDFLDDLAKYLPQYKTWREVKRVDKL